MKRITTNRRLAELEAENASLRADNERLKADRDYIAMMTDIELEEDEYEQEV